MACRGVTLDIAVLRKLWICLQTSKIKVEGGHVEKEKKKSQEDHGLALSPQFALAPGQKAQYLQWDTLMAFPWQTCLGSDVS